MGNSFQHLAELDSIVKNTTNKIGALFSSDPTKFKQGQFVVTVHHLVSALHCVGYLVQIRKDIGACRSDLVLFRTANGELIAWENQGFWAIDDEQEQLARNIFQVLPEVEEYSRGYSYGGEKAIGFIIEKPILTINSNNKDLITKDN